MAQYADELRQRKREAKLYDARFEHDGCGTGFVANIDGRKTHEILEKAIESVVNLTHRGAIGADERTGDGAGILTQIPTEFFLGEIERLGQIPPEAQDLAVGVIFLPREAFDVRERCRTIIEEAITRNKLSVITWREVPVNASILGEKAQSTRPEIMQVMIRRTDAVPLERYEQTLYLIRKEIEKRIRSENIENFYIPSFSSRTVVYKGLLIATQLKGFYLDLAQPEYRTACAVFHQRYSTNTFPDWFLAQPFRLVGHNGEINTLRGNCNWMHAREAELSSPVWGDKIEVLKPIITEGASDSACFDNALELLVMSGRDSLHAMMMLIPEAWNQMPDMDEARYHFYRYHACLTEPWDGPAAIAFSDGRMVGAALDRNGLRPARYVVTSDNMIVMGSEVGMVDLEDSKIVKKGRLGPGKMIAVDLEKGVLLFDETIKNEIVHRKPYEKWSESHIQPLKRFSQQYKHTTIPYHPEDLLVRQTAYGFTLDEVDAVIKPMVRDAKEAVASMGNDTPLSVFSERPKPLFTYFKQLFAQVTNPPIDPIRETLVMTLNTFLGKQHNLLEEAPGHAKLIQAHSPILLPHQMESLKRMEDPDFKPATIHVLFDVSAGTAGLEGTLGRLCAEAVQAIEGGARILILSDKGVSRDQAAIPMLLAVATVHHHLISQGKRMQASLVAETGEVCEVQHTAVMLGYGANAIHPYLTLETVRHLVETLDVKDLNVEHAAANYKKAIETGLLKIMSKMGISAVSSYRGAQIFEAIGLSRSLVDHSFCGTPSRVGGIGLQEIAEDVLRRHKQAFDETPEKLETAGFYRFRKGGEFHANSPDIVRAVQKLALSGKPEDYKAFSDAATHHPPVTLRDLLRFKKTKSIPMDEVEPIEEIRKRFVVSSMSHGALGKEQHECLAIAMNRMDAKSASGEGGEDPERFKVLPNGDDPSSRIKQIASGRFGVTTHYLNCCIEIEIKMAQGSKPGEGGQLPGHKVTEEIARIRHSSPGISLISPPPHHDIYSIEDLAQLIYDLKQVNPRARVVVKLVAEAGVGTVAAGVAKGHADVILISGHDGGTGASPLSSIKYAGVPWELGLSETQQVLMVNGLRERVRLRTDGGMKTGRDVMVAALLGAEEYGFGTVPLIASGCVMARACHLNTCPVGVATQREDLRAKFPGSADRVVNYFNGVAGEVRELLAQLGFRTLEDAIGRVDLLEQHTVEGHPRANTVDLSAILAQVDPHGTSPRKRVWERNDWDDMPLDDTIIRDSEAALHKKATIQLSYSIRNTNRSVGTKLSGEIAKRFGAEGLPVGTIECRLKGTAGQSFGAFLSRGVRLVLLGEANDYVGKGMSGGEIVVRPHASATFATHENSIMGNTVMYGATGGVLYGAGRAGERFCVRNSGAGAVIEGLGDHGCEYMTGGRVVVLGETGRNFGAGMTGGVAYILDEQRVFDRRYNPQLIQIEQLHEADDIIQLKNMIEEHGRFTQSPRAKEILENWTQYESLFWKVSPRSVKTRTGQERAVTAKAF